MRASIALLIAAGISLGTRMNPENVTMTVTP
jgi:hypothetical protein